MKTFKQTGAICVAAILLANCGGSGGSTTPTPVSPPPVPANNVPTIANANADQSGEVGQSFSYDATQAGGAFADADGDTLTYTVTFSPSAMGLTAANGVISGTPSVSGTITVTITASDGNGGQISDQFTIDVNDPPVTSDKPNIIFVISDDQGLDASAQYSISTDLPSTPNLTALANTGVIFDNLWVSPTCSPTRAALATGKHGVRTNVFAPGDSLPTSDVVIQSYLKNQTTTSAYKSAMIGKWHLGGGQTGPNDFGIEYFAGIITGGVGNYFNWTLNVNGATSNSTNYVTTELTDLAADWIDDQTSPWFLWLSYNAPHTPFHLPPTDLHNRNLSGTAADIDANRRDYYLASIEALDTEFGRLWNGLSAQERDNTIVIYIGDNGTPAQVKDRSANENGNKGDLLQGGVNTPMFVAGVGVTRSGVRESALINHTDFFATIAEIAGADLPSYLDGKSFAPLLTTTTGKNGFVYTENNDGFAIRDDQHKLIEASNGAQDLFDLQNDPGEQTDLLDGATDVSAILSALETQADELRTTENISGAKFANQSPLCTAYVGTYRSTATDKVRDITFDGTLEITAGANQCTISSNSIPNHDFNTGDMTFPNNTAPVSETFNVPINPVAAANPTALNLTVDNAIMLNGVKADVLAAACFGVGNEKTGCNNINQAWRFDPMHGPNGFNVDGNNAHTQPDGAYHYHGPPPITNGNTALVSGVIGFAADGFPIYGSYFADGATIRKAQPSYRLKTGNRPTGAGDPGGTYDGAFRDDYEFVAGQGDLDQCNGMTVNDQYGYYITDGYPYITACFTGTPDPSFNK